MTKTLTALTLAALAGMTAPVMAQDQYFEIINHSPRAVIEFYATPTSFQTWGDDLLGYDIIPVGASELVWIADNQTTCRYDVMFVLEGDYIIEDVHNICEVGQFILR